MSIESTVEKLFVMPLPAAMGCKDLADMLVEQGIPEGMEGPKSDESMKKLVEYSEFLGVVCNSGIETIVVPRHHRDTHLGLAGTVDPEMVLVVIALKTMGLV